MNDNDTPPPSAPPEADNSQKAGSMTRLVRRLRCAIMGHRCYLWADDEKTFLPVRISDDSVVATCARCGDTLSAVCAIYLPGMRYKAPENNLLLRPRWMARLVALLYRCRHRDWTGQMDYWWPTACNGYGAAIEERCHKCGAFRHRELKAGKMYLDDDWKPGRHPKSK